MLAGRALRRHCPQCGSPALFLGWFRMQPHCPRCGLATDRVVGHWIGAVGINTIVSFGALLVVLVGGFVWSYPEVELVPMMVACVATAIAVPLLFWPYSQTVWMALDLAMRPADTSELDPRYEL